MTGTEQLNNLFIYENFNEPGFTDNIALRYNLNKCDSDTLDLLFLHIKNIALNGNKKSKTAFEKIIDEHKIINFIGELLQLLVQNARTINMRPYLLNYAKELTYSGKSGELVKMGISLLGIVGCDKNDIEKIRNLALDEEYTIYCTATLTSLLENSEDIIWEIAQNTYGWGRINCLYKLRYTNNQKIKDWVLLEGYQNTIANEYTAFICATTGELHKALTLKTDRKIMNSASNILTALLTNSDYPGITDYKEAQITVFHYVNHIKTAGEAKDYAALIQILEYYNINKNDCGLIDLIENTLSCVKDINKLITGAENEEVLVILANYYRLDMWDLNWKKLKSNPLNPLYWRNAVNYLNEERINIMTEHMKTALPWRHMLKQPNEYSKNALNVIIDELRKYPDKGIDLLRLMLMSPVNEYRIYSIEILKAQCSENIRTSVYSAIKKAYKKEKDETIKCELMDLMQTNSLDMDN